MSQPHAAAPAAAPAPAAARPALSPPPAATSGAELTVIDTRAMVPRDIDQAWTLAENLAKSHLLPQALLLKPYDVFAILLTGHELGLTPMQAIRGIYVVEGRPFLSADLLVALCLRRRDVCEYFVIAETNRERATYRTKRLGCEPVIYTYTADEARTAGLFDKGDTPEKRARNNWNTNTADMLRKRAASKLARTVYPDIVFGIAEESELDEIEMRETRPGVFEQARTVAPPPAATRAAPRGCANCGGDHDTAACAFPPGDQAAAASPAASAPAAPPLPERNRPAGLGEKALELDDKLCLSQNADELKRTAAEVKAAGDAGQISKEERATLVKTYEERSKTLREALARAQTKAGGR